MRPLLVKLLLCLLIAGMCTGCALSYSINKPVPSAFQYDDIKEGPAVLQITDQRTDTHFFKGIGGLSKLDIKLENVDNPIDWLARALQDEFASRGTKVRVITDAGGQTPNAVLKVQEYQIANYRASGFTPWVAYHMFKGELISDGQSYPVQAYFLYGKVPVWSMTEVHEPCLSRPMTILVRDVASKVNRYVYKYRVSNARLEEIQTRLDEKLAQNAEDAYLSVLELGAANNPEAMKMLLNVVETEDTMVRACALSAMGTLGAENQYAFLKNKYAEYADIDRFMALKAIGDIGTPDAVAFLKEAKLDPQNEGEYGVTFCVDLYAD